mgnify:CR=1 FL=1
MWICEGEGGPAPSRQRQAQQAALANVLAGFSAAAGASAFVFFSLLALQGVLLNVLPGRLFTNVSFVVAASGTSPLSYQWRRNGANLAGATTTSLSLLNIQTANAGNYDYFCLVALADEILICFDCIKDRVCIGILWVLQC